MIDATSAAPKTPKDRMRAEVAQGLARVQKELPAKYFYDLEGSRLFEAITRLPEYYLTRAERALLVRHGASLVRQAGPRTLVELGAGSAEKTRILLNAMTRPAAQAAYVPVDVSAQFLRAAAGRLRREMPALRVEPVVADFTRVLHVPDDVPSPRLLAFLGSTIGNFDRPQALELLRRVRAAMAGRDRFLLGADLRKDRRRLEAAYNDAAGVTAAFNLNMLRVLNRGLGADFDLDSFRHRAFYDEVEHRIEMHLVAARDVTVTIPGLGSYGIASGETIRTEISCKYDEASIAELLDGAGLTLERWEPGDGSFALALAAPGS